MATWGRRRQIYYLTLWGLFLVVVIGGLVYWRWPAPSCFDGVQNNDEVGIDCGGRCARVCATEVEPLLVQWVRLLPVATSTYNVVALVENPNPRHGTAKLGYTIRVVDNNNGTLVRRSGETFANPKERFIIFESGLETGVRSGSRAFIDLEKEPVWQVVTTKAPALTVQKKDFINGDEPRLSALVSNLTLSAVSDIRVPVIISDAERNVIAASQTLVEKLAKDGREEIVYTWPAPLPVGGVFIDFYPRVRLEAD